jgi:ribonucleoside-triphosphate reductase
LTRRRKLGAKLLKAIASPLRLNILKLLSDRGPLAYTEIMNFLKLNPSRDAGRFAYHLKTLLSMDLIEPDSTSKKYCLTDLGKIIIEFVGDLDSRSYKRKLLVRTSRFSIENFDKNKIAESLVREAQVPIDLARKVSREAEKRLLKLGTKYLTAPLIREFVNSILIERGLEEYRHKLTRLGFPVYDVTLLMKEMSDKSLKLRDVNEAAGNRVIEEYSLLNVLPRNIADAHISGALNLNNLGCWILKINGLMHDIRFFFQNGLKIKNIHSSYVSISKPKSFKSALALISHILRFYSSEVSCEQGIDFFNVFLAPFCKNVKKEEIKDDLRLFLTSVNLSIPNGVSLGLETIIPDFISDTKVNRLSRDILGVYGDYADESQLIASIMLDLFKERKSSKPVVNPTVIIKLRPESFIDKEAQDLIYKAHNTAIQGLPYFSNLSSKEEKYTSYVANGLRFSSDWKNDWELDTIRTGCIDHVTLNLPRALYEAKKNPEKFYENINEISEKGLKALDIKYRLICQRARDGMLPFLLQKEKEDPYIRLENSTCLLSFVGLNETSQKMTGKAVYENKESLDFAMDIVSFLSKKVQIFAKKKKARFVLGLSPNFSGAKRLSELDIEKYGFGQVNIQGNKESPFYTNMNITPFESEISLEDYLNIEAEFQDLIPGSRLVKIPFRELNEDADTLLSVTKKIINNYNIGFYVFHRNLIYCRNCKETFYGRSIKCPRCGSVNAVTQFSREPARYIAK